MNVINEMMILKRTCKKCGYEWFPRAAKTKRCPRCQTWLRYEDETPKETITAGGAF